MASFPPIGVCIENKLAPDSSKQGMAGFRSCPSGSASWFLKMFSESCHSCLLSHKSLRFGVVVVREDEDGATPLAEDGVPSMGVSFQQGGPPSLLVLGLSLVKKRLN